MKLRKIVPFLLAAYCLPASWPQQGPRPAGAAQPEKKAERRNKTGSGNDAPVIIADTSVLEGKSKTAGTPAYVYNAYLNSATGSIDDTNKQHRVATLVICTPQGSGALAAAMLVDLASLTNWTAAFYDTSTTSPQLASSIASSDNMTLTVTAGSGASASPNKFTLAQGLNQMVLTVGGTDVIQYNRPSSAGSFAALIHFCKANGKCKPSDMKDACKEQ